MIYTILKLNKFLIANIDLKFKCDKYNFYYDIILRADYFVRYIWKRRKSFKSFKGSFYNTTLLSVRYSIAIMIHKFYIQESEVIEYVCMSNH